MLHTSDKPSGKSQAKVSRTPSAGARGFRMGAGLWFGFMVCALGTVCCLALVMAVGLVVVKVSRGSKGMPGSGTLKKLVSAVGARGGAGDGAGLYFEPAGRRETGRGAKWVEGRLVMAEGAPVVKGFAPADGAVGVAVNSPVEVRFAGMMNRGSLNGGTVVLKDAGGNNVAGRVSYNPADGVVTVDPDGPLQYGTKYTVTVVGGMKGVKGNGGVGMAAGDVSWSFTTGAGPEVGPGGPVLVVTNGGNGFSSYYAEILRAEGMNAFGTAELAGVTPEVLSKYGVVILGQARLTLAQVGMLTDWVRGGGQLIAMRPDRQLAGLLGLTPAGTTLANAYLRVDAGKGMGAGVTAESMQYHGVADVYELNGATPVAVLGGDGETVTRNPAVSIKEVGDRGGRAAAFAFDLAQSVVETRQGNPAWARQERDGMAPIRSDDLFYGNAKTDPRPDWVDGKKIQIPQADEQQRLLANLVVRMMGGRMPLPRFWYLPGGLKAVIVMTGDDHSHGGTPGRFDQFVEASAAGASVERWQAVRGTSYMYPAEWMSDAEAAEYVAKGFEIALHLTTYQADWTPAMLEDYFKTQTEEFIANYPSVPSPLTERTHSIVWSDYSTHAEVDFRHRVRFDANYYYWPGMWVKDRPGLFTGSGFPQRFATAEGRIIDVYQGTTQMNDEAGQSYPYHAEVLLDNALGEKGYYGMFVANMHTDVAESPGADAIVAAAQARGVPVISAVQAMRWLDGRNGSTFEKLTWDEKGRELRFGVRVAPGAVGLQGMVPLVGPGGAVVRAIVKDGIEQGYSVRVVKGIRYAMFEAGKGTYVVSYAGGGVARGGEVVKGPQG